MYHDDQDHDCYENGCGRWWCDACQDEHEENDWCDDGDLHQEYCDCSACRPPVTSVVTVAADGAYL